MQKLFLIISSEFNYSSLELNLSFEGHLISSGFKACQFCISIVTECLVAFEVKKFSYFVFDIIVFIQF